MSESSPAEPRPLRAWRLALLAVAALELLVAGVARRAAAGGWCPLKHGWISCAAVSRPRVSHLLGALSVGDLGILGASLSVALAVVFLRRVRLPLARDGALALAAGAGFAVGIQPLGLLASGTLCPACLTLTLLALTSAALTVTLAHRLADVGLRGPLLAGLTALVLTSGGAVWRGTALRREDAARSEAARSVHGERGPRIVLVALPGCPYCAATLSDVLGDPGTLALLQQTRGLEVVSPDDPRAAGLRGTPVLLAFDAQGHPLGEPLEGLPGLEEGQAWLRAAIEAEAGK